MHGAASGRIPRNHLDAGTGVIPDVILRCHQPIVTSSVAGVKHKIPEQSNWPWAATAVTYRFALYRTHTNHIRRASYLVFCLSDLVGALSSVIDTEFLFRAYYSSRGYSCFLHSLLLALLDMEYPLFGREPEASVTTLQVNLVWQAGRSMPRLPRKSNALQGHRIKLCYEADCHSLLQPSSRRIL